MKFAVVFTLVFLAVCAILCGIDLGRGPVLAPRVDGTPTSAELATALEDVALGGVRAAVARPPAVEAEAPPLEDDDLVALLRRTSRAYFDQDGAALESCLETLLALPSTPRRVLICVREGRFVLGSAEDQGCVFALGFAAGSERRRETREPGGRPLTLELCETLAMIPSERGEPIAEFTSSLDVEGRPAVGARWLTTILDLRERFPEHGSNLDPLLLSILASDAEIEDAGAEMADLAAHLSRSADPLVVRVALAVLLRHDPSGFAPIAEELFAASPRGSAVSFAIAEALARHAPVEVAAASLARLANRAQYGLFARLGARAGGLEAAAREYSALVATGANPLGRRLLVAAMSSESPRTLLGIAETDPDPLVRHQALLTATLQPTDGPEVMRVVRARHALRADSDDGLSTRAALSVAENVALHGSTTARAEAVRWLVEVAADASLGPEERRLAWTKLTARARPEELAGLEPPP